MAGAERPSKPPRRSVEAPPIDPVVQLVAGDPVGRVLVASATLFVEGRGRGVRSRPDRSGVDAVRARGSAAPGRMRIESRPAGCGIIRWASRSASRDFCCLPGGRHGADCAPICFRCSAALRPISSGRGAKPIAGSSIASLAPRSRF